MQRDREFCYFEWRLAPFTLGCWGAVKVCTSCRLWWPWFPLNPKLALLNAINSTLPVLARKSVYSAVASEQSSGSGILDYVEAHRMLKRPNI